MFALFAFFAGTLMAKPIKWEAVNDSLVRSFIEITTDVKYPREEEGVKIFARNGYIYVVTDHELPVQVFSILGHLIGEERLKQGIHRLPINARGIYIVKAGLATLRVTL